MKMDLLAILAPEAVDDYELLTVLERHYKSAGVGGRNQLLYPGTPHYCLKVWWKDGRIARIEPAPGKN